MDKAQIAKLSSLSEAQLYYIINSLATERTPTIVRQKFEADYRKTIDMDLILSIALDHSKQIAELKALRGSDYTDIRIATTRGQLEMLNELYDFCKEERVTSFNKDGIPAVRTEADTARRCVVDAARIIKEEKQLDLQIKEADKYTINNNDDEQGFQMPLVVHTQDE